VQKWGQKHPSGLRSRFSRFILVFWTSACSINWTLSGFLLHWNIGKLKKIYFRCNLDQKVCTLLILVRSVNCGLLMNSSWSGMKLWFLSSLEWFFPQRRNFVQCQTEFKNIFELFFQVTEVEKRTPARMIRTRWTTSWRIFRPKNVQLWRENRKFSSLKVGRKRSLNEKEFCGPQKSWYTHTSFWGWGHPLCASPPPRPSVFYDYSFCVHHPVNWDDRHLLAHAMASD
jgi:hypothetical protein